MALEPVGNVESAAIARQTIPYGDRPLVRSDFRATDEFYQWMVRQAQAMGGTITNVGTVIGQVNTIAQNQTIIEQQVTVLQEEITNIQQQITNVAVTTTGMPSLPPPLPPPAALPPPPAAPAGIGQTQAFGLAFFFGG